MKMCFAVAGVLIGSLCGMALAQEPAKDSAVKPLVAVPAFDNMTDGHVTRIAPGKYKERNVQIGHDSKRVDAEKEGERVTSTSHRDVYEKQLERVVEFAPGDWKLPESAAEIAADEVSSALTRSGRFSVLSRSKFSLRQRKDEDLYVGSDADLKLLRDLKAKFLVSGAIRRFRVDETRGTAYGVSVERSTARVTMDLRVVNVESGEIAYQATPMKSVQTRLLDGTTSTSTLDWEGVLRTAVRDSTDDMLVQLAKSTGATTAGLESVGVHVDSTPSGADILVNGAFMGNTPADIKVEKGRCTLRVERQGYQPWERTIGAFEGMKISPVMEPFPEAPKQALPSK